MSAPKAIHVHVSDTTARGRIRSEHVSSRHGEAAPIQSNLADSTQIFRDE
jgi:hypothetical protein